jgi:hypothetical protein
MSGKGGKGRGGTADEEARTPLQAVVLADSFTQVRRARTRVHAAAARAGSGSLRWRAPAASQRFRPCSVERPKVLMPLVNVPMLDYTLEWLASAGVEEARRARGAARLGSRRIAPSAQFAATQA